MYERTVEQEYVPYVKPQEHGNHNEVKYLRIGKIHLRVDYKMSGIGSHSYGPALSKKYRLDEKDIIFQYSMKPVR